MAALTHPWTHNTHHQHQLVVLNTREHPARVGLDRSYTVYTVDCHVAYPPYEKRRRMTPTARLHDATIIAMPNGSDDDATAELSDTSPRAPLRIMNTNTLSLRFLRRQQCCCEVVLLDAHAVHVSDGTYLAGCSS